MPFLLDSKPISDNSGDVTTRLIEYIRDYLCVQSYEDSFFSIRYFQKGTVHLTFKRPELIEKMNDINCKALSGDVGSVIVHHYNHRN